VSGQLSFIRNALLAPLDLIMFSKTRRKIITREELEQQSAGPALNGLLHLFSQHFNSLDLIEFICGIVDTEYFDEVRPVFELASKQCPELLCLGIAQFNVRIKRRRIVFVNIYGFPRSSLLGIQS
jgi:CCR4-NOT transcription complex subunit 1